MRLHRPVPFTSRCAVLMCGAPLYCTGAVRRCAQQERCPPGPLQTMSDRLKALGKALVMDPERTKDPVDFVQRLLQVRGAGAAWQAR